MTRGHAIVHEHTPAPLRSFDWRFLLPRPHVTQLGDAIVLGGPHGMRERALESGLARSLRSSLAGVRRADVIAVLDGADVSFPALAAALEPGGSVYLEVDRRRQGGAVRSVGAVSRQLRRAGLRVVGAYAFGPRPSEPRLYYIPLACPGALTWYVHTRHRPTTPGADLAARAVSVAGRVAPAALDSFLPWYAVVAVHAGVRMPPALGPEFAGMPAVETPHWPVMVATGGDRVVMLPFSRTAFQPAAVLKVPRSPAFRDRTIREQATLRSLHCPRSGSLAASIPRPFGTREEDGLCVAAESCLGGALLSRTSGSWHASRAQQLDDLRMAAEWLTRFHGRWQIDRVRWDAGQRAAWVERPLEEFATAFSRRAGERLRTALRSAAGALESSGFPLVWHHRDYNVWNLCRDGNSLAVLDWEGCRVGPPLCDLLHFATHWHDAACGARGLQGELRAFERLWLRPAGADPLCDAARRTVREYMDALSLPRALLPVLLVFTWVELSLRRLEQQLLQAEHSPDPALENRYVPFVELLAERLTPGALAWA